MREVVKTLTLLALLCYHSLCQQSECERLGYDTHNTLNQYRWALESDINSYQIYDARLFEEDIIVSFGNVNYLNKTYTFFNATQFYVIDVDVVHNVFEISSDHRKIYSFIEDPEIFQILIFEISKGTFQVLKIPNLQLSSELKLAVSKDSDKLFFPAQMKNGQEYAICKLDLNTPINVYSCRRFLQSNIFSGFVYTGADSVAISLRKFSSEDHFEITNTDFSQSSSWYTRVQYTDRSEMTLFKSSHRIYDIDDPSNNRIYSFDIFNSRLYFYALNAVTGEIDTNLTQYVTEDTSCDIEFDKLIAIDQQFIYGLIYCSDNQYLFMYSLTGNIFEPGVYSNSKDYQIFGNGNRVVISNTANQNSHILNILPIFSVNSFGNYYLNYKLLFKEMNKLINETSVFLYSQESDNFVLETIFSKTRLALSTENMFNSEYSYYAEPCYLELYNSFSFNDSYWKTLCSTTPISTADPSNFTFFTKKFDPFMRGSVPEFTRHLAGSSQTNNFRKIPITRNKLSISFLATNSSIVTYEKPLHMNISQWTQNCVNWYQNGTCSECSEDSIKDTDGNKWIDTFLFPTGIFYLFELILFITFIATFHNNAINTQLLLHTQSVGMTLAVVVFLDITTELFDFSHMVLNIKFFLLPISLVVYPINLFIQFFNFGGKEVLDIIFIIGVALTALKFWWIVFIKRDILTASFRKYAVTYTAGFMILTSLFFTRIIMVGIPILSILLFVIWMIIFCAWSIGIFYRHLQSIAYVVYYGTWELYGVHRPHLLIHLSFFTCG